MMKIKNTGGIEYVDTEITHTGANTAGVTLKSLTTAQRDLLVAVDGMLIFNTTTNQVEHFKSAAWGALAKGGLAIYGDGNDGNVTIAANTTLTSDMYYDQLTVNAAVTLDAAGFRIFCKTSATVNGTVSNSGAASTTGTGASGILSQVLGGSSDGGDAPNPGQNLTDGVGGTGGTGGGPGGAGGTITPPSENQGGVDIVRSFNAALTGLLVGLGAATNFKGGSGGGGGNTDGGGGGAGGGILTILAPTITGSGSIEARGGAGAPGQLAPGDGGGGGGGGIIMIITQSATAVTTDVTGGAGGAANGAGAAGSAGAAGTAVKLVNA